MAYLTGYQYYENSGTAPTNQNWGSYQYVSLEDVVNNFMLIYNDNLQLINNVTRYQVLFYAKRAIQELNYDAFKEVKVLELDVSDQLRFVLPPDFVNYVRISMFKDGMLYPLSENIQINSATSYLQDNNCDILFDVNGNILQAEFSTVDRERIAGTKRSIYLGHGPYNGREGFCVDGCWYFNYRIGARFGLNTETANINPTYRIDKKAGVINFSSGMANQLCVLEYVSDGMENGDDSSVSVNKLFEDYIYAYIKYAILNSKLGVQEYIVNRVRKDKSALLRNAKIRLSDIHPGRLLMNLRGQSKWIK